VSRTLAGIVLSVLGEFHRKSVEWTFVEAGNKTLDRLLSKQLQAPQ
jgi:hypothetical protein